MAFPPFHFKKFSIRQDDVVHPVGTDGVLLGAWAEVKDVSRILDIGTGSGLIALMLAQRTENQYIDKIIGLEIDAKTASASAENAEKSPWSKRLLMVHSTLQEYAHAQPFDLIVSNPPFFTQVLRSPDARRNLGRHTQTLPFEDLLRCARQLLAPDGRFCVILPALEGQTFCEMAVPLGLYWTKICHIHSREGKPVERCMIQLEQNPMKFERSTLCIYTSDGAYSDEFIQLTKDFYLAF